MKKTIFSLFFTLAVVAIACSCASCKNASKSTTEPDTVALVGPTFCADSAYAFAAKQCSFGERTMNSKAHDLCGEWIMSKFREFGTTVEAQDAVLTGWDGTKLKSRNIIARFRPEHTTRILLVRIGTAVLGQTTTLTLLIGASRLWLPTMAQAVWR